MTANQGPSRWKRLLYSILSVILGAFLFTFFVILVHMPHFDLEFLLVGTVGFGGLFILYSLPGWLLALPFILTVTDYSRWRFLAIWAIGTATGPLVMFATIYVIFVHRYHTLKFSPPPGFLPISKSGSLPLIGMFGYAASLACLITLLYLLLVRYDQHRAARAQTQTSS